MQCVDMLKQIASDDRDTEHQPRVPSHHSQTRFTQKPLKEALHEELGIIYLSVTFLQSVLTEDCVVIFASFASHPSAALPAAGFTHVQL